MGATDKAFGAFLLLVSIVVFVYYSIWVLLIPFIDANHPIQHYFLPYHYAIAIPAFLLLLLFTGTATFIGLVMIRAKPRKKQD